MFREQANSASLSYILPLTSMGWGGVDITVYRCGVGQFFWSSYRQRRCVKAHRGIRSSPVFPSRRRSVGLASFGLFVFFLIRALSLTRHGDIQPNPGPSLDDHGGASQPGFCGLDSNLFEACLAPRLCRCSRTPWLIESLGLHSPVLYSTCGSPHLAWRC